jgi:hypothetical protein
MSPKTKGRRRGARLPYSALLLLAGAVVAAITVTAPAAGTTPASGKPVIGKPVAVPAEPVAGKLFTVTFRVTRSDTGAPLARGTMICAPSVAGRTIPHTESFKRGTARLSLVVPASAAGKALKVKVTIKSGRQSATTVASFRVRGAQIPSVSISGSSAAEGNAGTTALSFPVSLSAVWTQTVSVA